MLFRGPIRSLACALGVCVALGGVVQAAPSASTTRADASAPAALESVLARFDQVQSSVSSLSAEFSQTTVNPLLKEPMTARGRFYLNKPDAVLWEYTAPESMHFVIANGRYTGYFPDRKRAESRDVHRWSEQIFRFFALGQASAELRKFYDISLEDPGPEMKDTHLLVLDPRKRRVRKRVEEVRLWIDARTWLPSRVEYVNREGATRSLVFKNMQVNPALSASLFSVTIPADVTVTQGFTEFGAGGPSAGSAR